MCGRCRCRQEALTIRWARHPKLDLMPADQIAQKKLKYSEKTIGYVDPDVRIQRGAQRLDPSAKPRGTKQAYHCDFEPLRQMLHLRYAQPLLANSILDRFRFRKAQCRSYLIVVLGPS